MNSQKMGVSDNLSCFHRTDNDIVIAYTKKSDKTRPAGRKIFFRHAVFFIVCKCFRIKKVNYLTK